MPLEGELNFKTVLIERCLFAKNMLTTKKMISNYTNKNGQPAHFDKSFSLLKTWSPLDTMLKSNNPCQAT